VIYELTELEDLRALVRIFAEIWGRPGEPPVDSDVLRALVLSGNYVAGASVDGRLVGGLIGWLGGPPPEHLHLHSHGLQWRDFVPLSDACRIVTACLEPTVPAGTYNRVYEGMTSIQNRAGIALLVSRDQTAFAALQGNVAPVLVPPPAAIFGRPTPLPTIAPQTRQDDGKADKPQAVAPPAIRSGPALVTPIDTPRTASPALTPIQTAPVLTSPVLTPIDVAPATTLTPIQTAPATTTLTPIQTAPVLTAPTTTVTPVLTAPTTTLTPILTAPTTTTTTAPATTPIQTAPPRTTTPIVPINP